MKLLWLAPVAIGLALVLTAPIAAAETRTPAQATAHALDELANCRAQNRPDAVQICPTETPTPTLSPTATLTPIPAATPTDMPTDAPEPTMTPLPAVPAPPPGDDPAPGYTRPLGNGWLELALPQGRWAVYQADDCAPQVGAWTEAWLTTSDDGEVDLNATGVACGLVAAVWQSDAPCALDDQGACQLVLDGSYWDMLGRTPTAVPSDTLTPTIRVSIQRAAAPAAASQMQVRTIVQTVIVVVTPELPDSPTETPRPTLTATLTPTSTPSVAPVTSRTPTPMVAVAGVRATGGPVESVSHVTSSAPGRWDWRTVFTVVAVIVLVVGLAWWTTTRRRVVVWRTRRGGAR